MTSSVHSAVVLQRAHRRETPAPGGAAEARAVDDTSIVLRLKDALEAHAVSYCQWKGHWDPDRWLRGGGDIDLLVGRDHATRCEIALASVGFKQVCPPPDRAVPGVLHYYALDSASNELIHVHLHYQLRLGSHWTMNYRLPMEEPLLESSAPGSMFRVPAPEFEFIPFVVRMVLAQPVAGSLFRRLEPLSRRRQPEWRYLTARVGPDRIREILAEHLPTLDARLFEKCVASLSPQCSTLSRLAVRLRLQRALRPYARRSALHDYALCFVARCRSRIQRAIGVRSGHRLMTGGATVAILGGDGAGKSTAVASLVGWLSETFDVSRTHLGKPPRSICTLTVSLLRRIKLLSSAVLDRVVPSRRARSAETSPPDLLLMLWWVCVARDRYRLYRRIRRQVALGRLVVCDRYPTRFIKGMDGPLIDGSATASRLIRLLQRLEASYYELIRPPDLLVLLRVDPEVAARRKTDEDAAYVRERCREVWELDLAEIDVRVVDANQPAPQVLADLRNVLWARL